jgi:hypothetical protein
LAASDQFDLKELSPITVATAANVPAKLLILFGGGGRSPSRTRLRVQIADNWEINGNFSEMKTIS